MTGVTRWTGVVYPSGATAVTSIFFVGYVLLNLKIDLVLITYII
jgi:hypothetical protein